VDDRRIGVRFPAGADAILFNTASRRALGPTATLVNTWISFSRSKAMRVTLIVHVHASSEAKKVRSCTSTRRRRLIVGCSNSDLPLKGKKYKAISVTGRGGP
jgi:hypothetical protein